MSLDSSKKYKLSARSYSLKAPRRMRPRKVQPPNRTKMFHVKHFGKIRLNNRTRRKFIPAFERRISCLAVPLPAPAGR
jgi:hypothetical protein